MHRNIPHPCARTPWNHHATHASGLLLGRAATIHIKSTITEQKKTRNWNVSQPWILVERMLRKKNTISYLFSTENPRKRRKKLKQLAKLKHNSTSSRMHTWSSCMLKSVVSVEKKEKGNNIIVGETQKRNSSVHKVNRNYRSIEQIMWIKWKLKSYSRRVY